MVQDVRFAALARTPIVWHKQNPAIQSPILLGLKRHSVSNHMKTSVATQNVNWQRSNIRFANDNVGPIWSEIDI